MLILAVVGLLVLVLVWASTGAKFLPEQLRARFVPESLGGGDICSPGELKLAVTPRMRKPARRAAKALTEHCRTFEISVKTADEVEADVRSGLPIPDLWVTDSQRPLFRVFDLGVGTQVVSDAVASTPVILAGGSSTKVPNDWGTALSSGEVAMPDPSSETVGTLTLAAPRAESAAMERTENERRQLIVPVAQAYAGRRATGRPEPLSLDTLNATSTRLVPATEQDYIAARRTNDQLRVVTPRTGALSLTFSVLTRSRVNTNVLRTAEEFADWFESAEGEEALDAARLRRADGSLITPGRGIGRISLLRTPDVEQVESDLRIWETLSVPSSVLAVFDVSGSMDFAAGASTRIELALDAAYTGLEVMPDHARIGVWIFSIGQGGPRRDWREVEPLRRLDDQVGAITQRELLQAHEADILASTQGGTGLYDTALAAYREAIQRYNPNYSNTVILFSDGANEDPGSITQRKLLRTLRGLVDPARPVRMLCVGISDDADFKSLAKISQATNGQAFLARNPNDLLEVFAQAIATRPSNLAR